MVNLPTYVTWCEPESQPTKWNFKIKSICHSLPKVSQNFLKSKYIGVIILNVWASLDFYCERDFVKYCLVLKNETTIINFVANVRCMIPILESSLSLINGRSKKQLVCFLFFCLLHNAQHSKPMSGELKMCKPERTF